MSAPESFQHVSLFLVLSQRIALQTSVTSWWLDAVKMYSLRPLLLYTPIPHCVSTSQGSRCSLPSLCWSSDPSPPLLWRHTPIIIPCKIAAPCSLTCSFNYLVWNLKICLGTFQLAPKPSQSQVPVLSPCNLPLTSPFSPSPPAPPSHPARWQSPSECLHRCPHQETRFHNPPLYQWLSC